jgi:hypothetical protein
MKFSLHSLIPFLPFLLNYSANCQLQRLSHSSTATASSGIQLNSQLTTHLELRNSAKYSQFTSSLKPVCTDKTENTVSNNTSIVLCLPICYLETGYSIGARVHFRGYIFTKQLPSNGRLLWFHHSGFRAPCHIAPFLRLFFPNDLQVYRHFFFPEGCACNVRDRSHLPPMARFFRDVYFAPAPLAPSLRTLVPSGSLIRSQSVQFFHHHPVFLIDEGNYQE